MINEEVQELVKEKNSLLIKLDSHGYKDDEAKRIDLKRVGELEKNIWDSNRKFIDGILKNGIPDFKEEPKKDYTATELRKILNDKYKYYQSLAKVVINEYYPELVKIKRLGKDINDSMKGNAKITKEIIENVIKY